jgi:hypothetical protein
MIVELGKEVDEILEILHLEKDSVTQDQAMELMAVCFKCFDKGFGIGTQRAIHTVQRMAINPQPIVNEIRKPVR